MNKFRTTVILFYNTIDSIWDFFETLSYFSSSYLNPYITVRKIFTVKNKSFNFFYDKKRLYYDSRCVAMVIRYVFIFMKK